MQVVIEVHKQENAHREGWIDIQRETERGRETTREVRDRDGQPARDSQVERGRETGRQPVEDRENPRRNEKGRGSQRPG